MLTSLRHRNLREIALAAALIAASPNAFTGQSGTLKRLELLSGFQVLLEYVLSVEDILVQHCSSSNPATPKLMELHREPILRALPRVKALLVKYRSKLVKELGEKEANRLNSSFDEKQTDLRQAFEESNRRDVAQKKFDCAKDPATLAGIPEEVEQALGKMELEQ